MFCILYDNLQRSKIVIYFSLHRPYLSVTLFFSCSQLRESSQQSQLWYHFVLNVNFEEGLLPPKIVLSVASSEALIQKCSWMKYGTSIVWRVFFWNSCFKYFCLILSVYSLKISRAPSNSSTPSGNNKWYILKQTFN